MLFRKVLSHKYFGQISLLIMLNLFWFEVSATEMFSHNLLFEVRN